MLDAQHSVIYFAVESEAIEVANQPIIPQGFDFLPVFLAGTSVERVYDN
jgi:hypothetical protein